VSAPAVALQVIDAAIQVRRHGLVWCGVLVTKLRSVECGVCVCVCVCVFVKGRVFVTR
jgi:hypothetical protein